MERDKLKLLMCSAVLTAAVALQERPVLRANDDRWVTLGGKKKEGDTAHKGRRVKLDDNGNIIGGNVPKSAQGKPVGGWWKNDPPKQSAGPKNAQEHNKANVYMAALALKAKELRPHFGMGLQYAKAVEQWEKFNHWAKTDFDGSTGDLKDAIALFQKGSQKPAEKPQAPTPPVAPPQAPTPPAAPPKPAGPSEEELKTKRRGLLKQALQMSDQQVNSKLGLPDVNGYDFDTWRDNLGDWIESEAKVDVNTDMNSLINDFVAKNGGPKPKAKPAEPPKPVAPPKPKAPSVPFTPAKDVKSAAKWAMDNNIATKVDYTGCHIEVANQWNQSIHESVSKFPMLRDQFVVVGTAQYRNKVQYEQRYKDQLASFKNTYPNKTQTELEAMAKTYTKNPKKIAGNNYAQACGHPPHLAGVCVNSKWGKNAELFKASVAQGVASKFHPEGCATIKSIVDHEVGHSLDTLLGISKLPEVQAIWNSCLSSGYDSKKNFNAKMTDTISTYAASNIREMTAEAWSEYTNNPNPRPAAKLIGELIEAQYKKQHGGA